VPAFAAELEWGPVWVCGALHDACYRDQLEVWDDQGMGGWKAYSPTKEESDLLFKEAMECQGVEALQRSIFYEAVVVFGKTAFRQDRRAVQQ
jgi:hypothetical protein